MDNNQKPPYEVANATEEFIKRSAAQLG